MAGNKTFKGAIIAMEKDSNGKKKANNKCRVWKLVVSLGKDKRTGKYPQKARVFRGTYTEAKEELRNFVDELTEGKAVKKNGWTLNDYIDHFISEREETGDFAQQTMTTDRNRLKALGHVIGALKMQEIDASVLESAYADMRRGVSRSGRKLSATYVCEINETTTLLMDMAVREGVIGKNPCKEAEVPQRDTKEKKALSDSQITELLAKLDCADPFQCAVALYLTEGLRRGEACGLSRGDLDFDAGTVFVHRNFDSYGNLKETKTEASVRYLPMSEFAREALMTRIAALVAMYSEPAGPDESDKLLKLQSGAYDLTPDVPIISDHYGERMLPQKVGSWWSNNRRKFGLPDFTLHELRHSFLTVAARNGIHPSVMQHLAGHTNSKITMEIYTHVNMEQKRAAMSIMQDAFKTQKKTA